MKTGIKPFRAGLKGLRAAVLFEGEKGGIVLGAGLGMWDLIHRDVQGISEALVTHFHRDQAKEYPRVLLQLARESTSLRLFIIASGAMAYGLIRFVEAYGLWHGRTWAEWLGTVSCGLYLPLEIWDIRKGFDLATSHSFCDQSVIHVQFRSCDAARWNPE